MASLPSLDQLPTPSTRSVHLLRETVYDVLKGAIIGGTLPPGERLRDGEIAEHLGVSKMPVREALRRLADEGLVIAEANRWTKVAPIDIGAAARVYPIIWTLECLALRLVPAWTEDRLDRLRSANDATSSAPWPGVTRSPPRRPTTPSTASSSRRPTTRN